MSYDAYPYPPVPPTKAERFPLLKNFSFVSLAIIIASFIVGFLLNITVLNPMISERLDSSSYQSFAFIVTFLSLAVYITSLVFAIKGKSRNHTPILAVVMIIISSILIAQSIFSFGLVLILSSWGLI